MKNDPLILGFDTSGPYCAAALVRRGDVIACVAEDMTRGQAERLMSLLEETLTSQGVTWSDLDALAVGTGPGNFTGIRIGVSAARGVALGLAIPAYGVTGFQSHARIALPGTTVTINAPRDMVYISDAQGPRLVPKDEVPNPAPQPTPAALAKAIAQHATSLWPAPCPAPAPYYVRAPDAAPARDAPPKVLS
ncbi:tRNA (adenosine(37)-N6)-threonylcarbamoyltransferase complex dimerization subunit type 1 TsaB [Tateyamaria sp.]|uniref:tRNA (adenosine(37)-N6)-threonylcarbamoyltransferase complex dimerization subunit type 1 TsaB n=1 Tax=Tateyamaria sp. TaxID=1929288 RepID=UPI0032A01D58